MKIRIFGSDEIVAPKSDDYLDSKNFDVRNMFLRGDKAVESKSTTSEQIDTSRINVHLKISIEMYRIVLSKKKAKIKESLFYRWKNDQDSKGYLTFNIHR